ncbi:MAG: phage tail protein [Calditrichaeota bacterium]|nr:MAG: phage tail protein [Calditrichota bacterium]
MLSTTQLSAQEPMLGEIKMFGGNFAPRGWALCDGQLLSIAENQALFSLLGTIYGGDGRTTFGLPDLRGRAPIHAGSGPGLAPKNLGQRGGVEQVILNITEIPSHSHTVTVKGDSSVAKTDRPEFATWARNAGATPIYGNSPNSFMNGSSISIGNTGGNLPHTNMQPYLAVNYIIALQGVFPSRN